jgi:hypothetical protein
MSSSFSTIIERCNPVLSTYMHSSHFLQNETGDCVSPTVASTHQSRQSHSPEERNRYLVRVQDLMEASINTTVFWNTEPCSLVEVPLFPSSR